jgi:nicotinamide-nucleotide amidase
VSAPTVEILAVGSEFLGHGRQDSNSVELSRRFTREGFHVVRRTMVGDDLPSLTEAFREATRRSSLVISTGGLGPTGDDRTREALAAALDRPLHEEPALVRTLREKYQRVARKMPQSNLRQAQVPRGAVPLANPEGTAPGLLLDHGVGMVLALPGPPVEMRSVLSEEVLQQIRQRLHPPAVAVRVVRTAGMAESELEDHIRDLYGACEGTELTVLASPGDVEVLILTRHADAALAGERAEDLAHTVASRLGAAVFASEDRSLGEVLGERLRAAGTTVAVAESCTAGMLGEELTRSPGASDFFLGGVIAYSDEIKQTVLGVPQTVIQQYGAVSEPTALAMAEAVRRRFGAHVGLSITGVAGPGGGTADKPVGLVYLALATGKVSECRRLLFPGSRQRVRRWAVARALDGLRRFLERSETGAR